MWSLGQPAAPSWQTAKQSTVPPIWICRLNLDVLFQINLVQKWYLTSIDIKIRSWPTFLTITFNPLTLIQAMSETPCQRGGPLSWLWIQYLLKNPVPSKVGINSNSLNHFLEIRKVGSSKKQLKLKMYSKISNNCTFCNFEAISTSYTSKESIFHLKFYLKQKKYGLFEKN